MAYVIPLPADFKLQFVRDFPYGPNVNQNVLDADITNALNMAGININQALFMSQTNFTTCYCLLAAHYLCTTFQAAAQGIQGQFSFINTAKTVGPVSQAFGIPEQVLKSPYLAMLCATRYGAQYVSIMAPFMVGAVAAVSGAINP